MAAVWATNENGEIVSEETSDDGERLIAVTGFNFLPTGKKSLVQVSVPRELIEDFLEKLHKESHISFIRDIETSEYESGREDGDSEGFDRGYEDGIAEGNED